MRDELLATARRLFAERGFEGVSLSAIAGERAVSKQALLHHFSTKEKLYGEVLAIISAEYANRLETTAAGHPGGLERLEAFFTDLLPQTARDDTALRIIMRELLDNNRRAEKAGTWYLKGFLETLIRWAGSVPGWEEANEADLLVVIYQLIGAVSYAAVSGPTLRGIFGDERYADFQASFGPQIKRLIASNRLLDDPGL